MRKALCYRFRENGNLRHASFLHATSTQEATSIRRLDIGPEVVVVPNGVDEPGFGERSDFRVRWELPENARLVTFLGRLHPTKRLDLLVASFQSVQSAVPDSVLVLAGRPDGIDPESLGLGREIRWLGELDEDEKWKLLSETAVLVMCSDSESFGMSILEALSAGVPVVATRSCPWEEIEAHGCGFWVAQDPQRLAESIRRILLDSTLAKQMGARGRALAAARYRWPAIGREMARCYEKARAMGSSR